MAIFCRKKNIWTMIIFVLWHTSFAAHFPPKIPARYFKPIFHPLPPISLLDGGILNKNWITSWWNLVVFCRIIKSTGSESAQKCQTLYFLVDMESRFLWWIHGYLEIWRVGRTARGERIPRTVFWSILTQLPSLVFLAINANKSHQ